MRSRGTISSEAGPFASAALALLVAHPCAAAASDGPAASMRDLRDHFAGCLRPPAVADTRLTFYFSLNARGALLGRPRATWLGVAGEASERRARLPELTDAFRRCLPVSLDPRLAAGIPGEVYFLQFVVGGDGRVRQVLLRPFGSHGGVGPSTGPGVGPVEPPLPEAQGPDPRRFQPFRPQPGRGSFFHPPIVVPFGRAR